MHIHKNRDTLVFNVIGSSLKYDVRNVNDIIPKENVIILEGHISPPVPSTTYATPLTNIYDIGIAIAYVNHHPLFFNHSKFTGAYI
jgi:hypothetical protein